MVPSETHIRGCIGQRAAVLSYHAPGAQVPMEELEMHVPVLAHQPQSTTPDKQLAHVE